MNVELLLKVKDQILAEPRQFQMELFYADAQIASRVGSILNRIPNCGTAACIAGWALALHYGISPSAAKGKCGAWSRLDKMAAELLEIDKEEINFNQGRLFLANSWPAGFKEAYLKSETPAGRAKVAAKRIDHFIATNGRE